MQALLKNKRGKGKNVLNIASKENQAQVRKGGKERTGLGKFTGGGGKVR